MTWPEMYIRVFASKVMAFVRRNIVAPMPGYYSVLDKKDIRD